MGVHYPGDGTCILEIHGMSGNFIENYYANILGEKLSKLGYGFIYGHNRGYCHINDIAKKPIRPKDNGWNYERIGEVYELFEDSPKDVSVWVNKAKELGYKNIILLGHSLGCNKTIYYLYKNQGVDIKAVILASPPDMYGLVNNGKLKETGDKMRNQAMSLVASGKPRAVLDDRIWDWYGISAQTYLSLFSEGGAADNLPVLRSPERFEQLETIKQPILAIMGEHDDVTIRNLKDDLELIKSKALAAAKFDIKFIEGANHNYENREELFSDVVIEWVKQL
jgi:pimeloyl-ACP methyl ester carboxylesterase